MDREDSAIFERARKHSGITSCSYPRECGTQAGEDELLLLLVCHFSVEIDKVLGHLIPVLGEHPAKQQTFLAVL